MVIIACFAFGPGRTSHAHPISLSDAVIDIRANEVSVELRILCEELVLYYEIAANGKSQYPSKPLREAATKHSKFLRTGLTLRDSRGNRLPLDNVDVDAQQIRETGVPQTQLKTVMIKYSWKIAVKAPLEFLTVVQNFGGDQAIVPSLMDCLVLQNGFLIDKSQQLLANRPLTVRFDWKNPPTKPANIKELRARREERERDQLGIASYSGLYSFIYITPREVRHEILVPVLTLETWIPIRRQVPEFLEVDEQEKLRPVVESFFRKHNRVQINRQDITPKVDRLSVFGLDINDFARNSKPRRVSMDQARLGVILSYTARTPPRRLTMQWDALNRYAPFMKSVVYVGDAPKTLEHIFMEQAPTFAWQGRLPNVPGVAPVRRKPGQFSESIASRVVEELLRNIYRAFDETEEAATYDALSLVATGDVLRDLYLQMRRSLLVTEQGGAQSHVESVRIVSGQLERGKDEKSFRLAATFRVVGTIEHWGHVHLRENEYRAQFEIGDRKGDWKLTHYSFRDQKRLRFQTKLRGKSSR